MNAWLINMIVLVMINCLVVVRVARVFAGKPALRLALYAFIWLVPLVGAILARFAANESMAPERDHSLEVFAIDAIAESKRASR